MASKGDLAMEEIPDEWMQLIAHNWDPELSDPREDIYTVQDGDPVVFSSDLPAPGPSMERN